MNIVTLDQADRLIDAAFAAAVEHGFAPLCAAVLDAGGHLIAMKRQDGASPYRIDIACAKAAGCIGMGVGSRRIAANAAKVPAFYAALNVLRPILPVPGGVLIRSADGVILGAIGISGDTADNDETCAVAGIEAASMMADTGA